MSIIENKEQLINYFISGIKKKDQLRIGVEHEKFLFHGDDKKRATYDHVKTIFKNLETFGWKPFYEKENVLGLTRGEQKITLEPGLQYELSGAPLKNIHLVCSESSAHFKEIKQAAKNLDIYTASVGFDPFNKLEEAPKNPKKRYKIMTEEMPKGGELSLQMMYQTSGIQINLDYTSESNFEKIFKVTNYLAPLTIAIFANSPFVNRKFSGYLSYRNKVWQNTSRGGIMPLAFEKITFEKYVDQAINYSLLFLMKDDEYISPNGQTFKDFMDGNFKPLKGIQPTIKDFENHLGTIFTEARLKQFVEIRTLDTCDWNCICNGPAFFTGLIYGSIDEAYDIIKHWKKEDVLNAYLSSTQKGLDAEIGNKKLLEWGKVFLGLAKKGLEKRNELNSKNNNETIYLKHIEDILDRKKNRAQLLLEQFNEKGNLEFFNYNNEDFSYSGF